MDANSNRVNEDTERAEQQASAQLASIEELVKALAHTEEVEETSTCSADCPDGTVHDPEAARQAILDDPLSVEVRGDWHVPGAVDACAPYEYKILLCWGGPAVQIVGMLDDANQPYSARLQYRDWFTEWTNYPLTDAEEETLLKYAQQFSFDL
jgi:hypothetical protein